MGAKPLAGSSKRPEKARTWRLARSRRFGSPEPRAPKGARGEALEVVGEPMSETRHTFVRFNEVQKSYDGETLVVKNLNLDIERGEFLTMLGPSGSGKTTCLLMLAGFEPVTYG